MFITIRVNSRNQELHFNTLHESVVFKLVIHSSPKHWICGTHLEMCFCLKQSLLPISVPLVSIQPAASQQQHVPFQIYGYFPNFAKLQFKDLNNYVHHLDCSKEAPQQFSTLRYFIGFPYTMLHLCSVYYKRLWLKNTVLLFG